MEQLRRIVLKTKKRKRERKCFITFLSSEKGGPLRTIHSEKKKWGERGLGGFNPNTKGGGPVVDKVVSTLVIHNYGV